MILLHWNFISFLSSRMIGVQKTQISNLIVIVEWSVPQLIMAWDECVHMYLLTYICACNFPPRGTSHGLHERKLFQPLPFPFITVTLNKGNVLYLNWLCFEAYEVLRTPSLLFIYLLRNAFAPMRYGIAIFISKVYNDNHIYW